VLDAQLTPASHGSVTAPVSEAKDPAGTQSAPFQAKAVSEKESPVVGTTPTAMQELDELQATPVNVEPVANRFEGEDHTGVQGHDS
jgi:hypothetical protein